MDVSQLRVCVVGLGYVGLPLAHAFAAAGFPTIGYDISAKRVDQLKKGIDWTNELSTEQLQSVNMTLSSDPAVMHSADVIILAIPTPIDDQNNPDLEPVKSASEAVGKHMKAGAIVVFESTVYPGTTEEICGPILETASGLKQGKDFKLGYSPERINPGDKEHTVTKIVKVVAGEDEHTTDILCELYGTVITAGVHRAPNIKVAEMAKAIENAQRDLNIAFVNEIALMCDRLGVQTKDVLSAAGTKWNFLRFQPGLVGGHCIGVDPYYLVEKAKQMGMETHVITAGRKVNDSMAAHVAEKIISKLPVPAKDAKVLVLGLTFKENIPDTRNSKSFDVITALQAAGCTVTVQDPFVEEERMTQWKLTSGSLNDGPYHAIALLVPHAQYLKLGAEAFRKALTEGGVMFDLKALLAGNAFAGRTYLSL